MTSSEQPQATERTSRRAAVKSEREELLEHVQGILEPIMTVLGFVFLGLLLLEFSSLSLPGLSRDRIGQALQVIWVVFLLDFGFRIVIAPAKWTFLRQNWLARSRWRCPSSGPCAPFGRRGRCARSASSACSAGSTGVCACCGR